MKELSQNFLLEIGTEELPASVVDYLYAELAAKTEKSFTEFRLTYSTIKVEATPRRLALCVENLAIRQEDQTLEFSGPSFEKSYDASGKPTPALEGFLRSKNASIADVVVKEIPKGKFISVTQHAKGKSSTSVLPQIVHQILNSLVFAKTMRWDSTGFRFPRPIRWIVSLLGNKQIPIQISDVKSGNTSFGHRFLAPKALKVTKADWDLYRAALKKSHVIIEREARKQFIRESLQKKFNQQHFDEELVELNANLVEEPFLLQGNFNKDYLKLPAEVLACNMKKNQKIFACYDAKGEAVSHFIAVLNGKRNGLKKIQTDYENVLESRLRDGRYFYDLDTEEPLEKKLPLLEQIVYLGKLGSMKDKTIRMEKLAEKFCDLAGKKDLTADLKRAARLSKIDLMTKLVYEFPELQGIVGGAYAKASGEKQQVINAISAQYLPKSLTESFNDLKKEHSLLDALLGIIDRLDFLVGAFGVGLEPTGSQDPYALRRAAGVLVKWVRAFDIDFSWNEAVEASTALYGPALEKSGDAFKQKLSTFMKDRVTTELQLKPGTRSIEIFQAVWDASSSARSFADILKRYDVLSQMYEKDTPTFMKAAKIVERTANILKGIKGAESSLNTELLKEPTEKVLGRLCEEKLESLRDIIQKKDYAGATRLYAQIFFEPVSQFFDQVMVNVEDAAIRSNRQALVRSINRLYSRQVADLSVLSRMDQE